MYQEVDGKKLEPVEEVVIQVEEEHVGGVIEALSMRKCVSVLTCVVCLYLISLQPNAARIKAIYSVLIPCLLCAMQGGDAGHGAGNGRRGTHTHCVSLPESRADWVQQVRLFSSQVAQPHLAENRLRAALSLLQECCSRWEPPMRSKSDSAFIT
jgi:hypothetical protein